LIFYKIIYKIFSSRKLVNLSSFYVWIATLDFVHLAMTMEAVF